MDNPLRSFTHAHSRHKQLSKEIKRYLTYVQVCPEEAAVIYSVFEKLRTIIRQFCSTAQVYLVGSAATDLRIYNCDIDIAVPNVRLADIFSYFYRFSAIKCEFINCKHPIIAGELDGFYFDISAYRALVLRAVDDANQLGPVIVHLLQLLKEVLRSHGLNSLRDGGISSYLLLYMVYAYVSTAQVTKHKYAYLLLGFLDFYAHFDFEANYISDGRICKRTFEFTPGPRKIRPQLVILVHDTEIGGAISNFSQVQLRFERFHAVLSGQRGNYNMLGRIIQPDLNADYRRVRILEAAEIGEV